MLETTVSLCSLNQSLQIPRFISSEGFISTNHTYIALAPPGEVRSLQNKAFFLDLFREARKAFLALSEDAKAPPTQVEAEDDLASAAELSTDGVSQLHKSLCAKSKAGYAWSRLRSIQRKQKVAIYLGIRNQATKERWPLLFQKYVSMFTLSHLHNLCIQLRNSCLFYIMKASNFFFPHQ
ncbi:unnamed protein product [Lactuca saligna]|uniref:Uncharacterized protein n=1 Tax=Lactuca saligna TaxID=75948 RepID=A0AA35YSU0_LACSI|nr:unnamed protein product [Lactuca saligna]